MFSTNSVHRQNALLYCFLTALPVMMLTMLLILQPPPDLSINYRNANFATWFHIAIIYIIAVTIFITCIFFTEQSNMSVWKATITTIIMSLLTGSFAVWCASIREAWMTNIKQNPYIVIAWFNAMVFLLITVGFIIHGLGKLLIGFYRDRLEAHRSTVQIAGNTV
jgi:hypothetical protein